MDASINVSEDERMKILKMVEDGKINASEGAELLGALGQGKNQKRGVVERKPSSGGSRWFHVQVTDMVTGKSKTTVTIPLGLMDWGLKLGAKFAPEADIDLDELRQALTSGLEGKIIDVVDDEDGEHVEIYVD